MFHKGVLLFRRASSYIFLMLLPGILYGAVMTSGSYKIELDSVNTGGNFSTSTNFGVEDTLGEVATGKSNSSSYILDQAGYQMTDNTISITSPSDVTLSSLGGVSGGESTGSATWKVTTGSPGGYVLYIESGTNPALQSTSAFFANYTTAGSDPDFNFSVANSDSEFGFSPEGVHIDARFKDDGVGSCNTGGTDTSNSCWEAFSTTPQTIAGSTSQNSPLGTDTTVKFRAFIGSNKIQDSGTYTATITVTALAL